MHSRSPFLPIKVIKCPQTNGAMDVITGGQKDLSIEESVKNEYLNSIPILDVLQTMWESTMKNSFTYTLFILN
jgi:hypothetical protein